MLVDVFSGEIESTRPGKARKTGEHCLESIGTDEMPTHENWSNGNTERNLR